MAPGPAASNRRIVTVADSVLRIEQRIRSPHIEIGTDVSGPACVYATVHVASGRVGYLQAGSVVDAPESFAVFLPPFAVVQARLEACDAVTRAVAFRPPRRCSLPGAPLLLATADHTLPESIDEALRRLAGAQEAVNVARAPAPSALALRAKTLLDAEYHTGVSLQAIARRVHAAPATLSRTFGQTYGLPPVRYRHHLRIMDALTRFAEGAVPAEVFQDVGFDDLSRFYKIFRKVACAAPGSYRPPRSRNAKT